MAKAPPDRNKIADEHKWSTQHLYASDEQWEQDRERLVASFPELESFKGQLAASDDNVLRCLQAVFAAERRLDRVASYASRKHDEDTRVARYQAMKDVTDKVSSGLRTATSYVQPELLALPLRRLRALIDNAAFADFSRYLTELLRQKKHVLSPPEEALLARASLMADAGYNTYSTFSGADLTFPTIRDERGRLVRLTQALFSRYRASHDRQVRKAAFDALFGTFGAFRNTLATMLGAQVDANVVQARARRYDSALQAALYPDDIPVPVYTGMIEAVNRHLPLLHRYMKLRRKLLGLRELRYYDLYAPLVEKVSFKFPYAAARELLVEALAPLGADYVHDLAASLAPQSGWIDVFPNAGKRSGAYMDGAAYDVHPYVLANYLDDYNSVSTLAHEMGHAMHSHYSNAHQPYPKADYAIFVAEVASTLNEVLLVQHLLQKLRGKQRLHLLVEHLEGWRQTYFRQAMFAEFELEIYRRAERTEALTAESLTELYLATARRYYGHAAGVVRVDDAYGVEWSYIPHFYYNFYVFQYVTGMTAAAALAEQLVAEGERARQRYVKNLLQAGGSRAPIDILRSAGVDLTTSAPYDTAMQVFERTLDEAESLIR